MTWTWTWSPVLGANRASLRQCRSGQPGGFDERPRAGQQCLEEAQKGRRGPGMTYFLLATLVARALHGRVAPRRRGPRIVAIFLLFVAGCGALEAAGAGWARGRQYKGVLREPLRRAHRRELHLLLPGELAPPTPMSLWLALRARGGGGNRSDCAICSKWFRPASPAHRLRFPG
jgi:hypothetical protein